MPIAARPLCLSHTYIHTRTHARTRCRYSATKGLNALVMAVLNDRKRLQYDAPVAQYWPEFGQRGKENITVSQALSHQSGVSTVETKRLSIQEWASAAPSLILEQQPLWTPGPAQFG